MKKILFILLFVTAFSGLLHAQTTPVSPSQMNQVTWYYEPSTTLRWGFNATRGWFLVPDSAKVVQWIGGRGGGDTVSFQQDQFINTGTPTNAHIALRAKDTTGVDSVLAWKNNKLYKILGGGGGTNLGNSDLTQTDPTRTFTIGTGSLVFTGTNGSNVNTTTIANNQFDSQITDGSTLSDIGNTALGGSIGTTDIASNNSSSLNSFGVAGGETGFSLQNVDGSSGFNRTIYSSTGSGSNPGIIIHDGKDHVALIGDEVFPISDGKQYAQYDKVDSLIAAAGSTLNFTNGLNQDGADVRLGGTLTDPTNIDVSNHFLDFTSDGVANGSILEHDINDFGVTTTATDTATRNRFISTITGSAVGIGLDNLDNINRSLAFNIDSAKGFQLLDDRFKQGIKYTHFANWLSLKDSSLVPRKYAIVLMDSVKATISGGTGTVTSITPGVGFLSHTPITTSGTMNVDTASTIVTKTFAGKYATSASTNTFTNKSGNISQWTNDSGYGTGTVTAVTGTANRITSTGGTTPVIDISASYVGQSSITTVGTLSAGSIPYSLLTGTPTVPTAANPTATATTTAVNGVATTFMRSDAAPKVDSTVFRTVANSYSLSGMATKLSNYALTSSLPVAGNPSGLLTFTAANGSNTTYERTDGLHAIDSTVVASKAFVNNLASKSFAAATYVPLTRTVAGFALSSNVSLASLTATDASLTFSGSYDGSTARTVGLNLANANTWTAAPTFNKAGIATTLTDGAIFQNSTLSTSGVTRQLSPSTHWQAHVWNTTSTAADNFADWVAYADVTSGTNSTISTTWTLAGSRTTTSTPSYSTLLTVKNDGTLTATGPIYSNGLSSTSSNTVNANFYTSGGSSIGMNNNSATLLFHGAANVSNRTIFNGLTSNTLSVGNSLGSVEIGSQTVNAATSGTHDIIANFVVKPVNITTSTSTITNSVTAYFDGKTIGGTNAFTIWALGPNRMSGLRLDTLTASKVVFTDASKNLTSTGIGTSSQFIMGDGSLGTIGTKPHTIFTPTTGGTVALTNNQYNIINPAGTLLALTVNLPSSPANNDCVFIKFTQNVTTVTYGNGTVVDGIAGPIPGTLVVLVFDSSSGSWY